MHTQTKIQPVSRPLVRGLAAGLLLAQLGTHVQGQEAPAASSDSTTDEAVQLDTLTVKAGFSGSLALSAEAKKEQPLVTEIVSAEDIGKLPDISIAESLTRLPGVTTQRQNGRAQAIVIRGMNGDFSTALLNGRQQVSTGSGRAVEFDQYPAELLNRVVVYKTADAGLIGQGLAGTVDLQTVRPLSRSKREVAVNAFYEWTGMPSRNAGAKSGGWRETLSYVDQSKDKKFGIAVGISSSTRPGQGEQFNAWGYDTGSSFGGKSIGQTASLLGGAKPFVRTSEVKRDGYMGVIEMAPMENVHSTIDLYYSNFQETQLLRGIEMPLSPNWGTYTNIDTTSVKVTDGLVTDATLNNFYGVVRNDFVKRNDHLFSGGWNLELGNKKEWLATFDATYSRVKRKDFVLETYSGFGVNGVGTPDTITYHLSPDGSAGATFDHKLDYSDGTKMRLGMPQGWGTSSDRPYGQDGFLKGPIARDKIEQYKATIEHPLPGLFNRIEAGLVWNKRDKYETESGPNGMEGYFLQLKNKAPSAPLPASVGLTDLSFIGMGQMYSYDPLALYESGFYDQIANNDPARMANNWSVQEKVLTSYLKSDLSHKFGKQEITGNVGVQLINTKQTSTGQAINSSTLAITDVTAEHTYTDVVPSLNLNYLIDERNTVRLSVARQLARQQMNDMRAGSNYSFDSSKAGSTDPLNSPWSSSGGNPNLEPWRSNSYDLSFEHYFDDNMGYWAVSAFYKSLVSYTYTQNKLVDFTGLPTGTSTVPAIYQGYSSVPQNGQGGSIKGIEFALSLPGEKFAKALKGWGIVGSYSLFSSSIQPDLNNPSTPLVGLSDRVASGTVYYERYGFSARLSARYRSAFRGDIATFGPRGAVYRNLQPETVVDAQVSYSFRKGFLKNMTIIAQAYNLTDEPLIAVSGSDLRYIQDYQRYGPSYSVGASYKF